MDHFYKKKILSIGTTDSIQNQNSTQQKIKLKHLFNDVVYFSCIRASFTSQKYFWSSIVKSRENVSLTYDRWLISIDIKVWIGYG